MTTSWDLKKRYDQQLPLKSTVISSKHDIVTQNLSTKMMSAIIQKEEVK